MTNTLSSRMEEYENNRRYNLVKRIPVIIKIKTVNYQKFSKDFRKPFDRCYLLSMQKTMKQLCMNVPNCVFGYTVNNTIYLILVDYNDIDVKTWYNNEIQKISSATSSMATAYFNDVFKEEAVNMFTMGLASLRKGGVINGVPMSRKDFDIIMDAYNNKIGKCTFVANSFNIPVSDVCNYFVWAQSIGIHSNLIQVAKEALGDVEGYSPVELEERLVGLGISRESYPHAVVYGSTCVMTDDGWFIDNDCPEFKTNRDIIENIVISDDYIRYIIGGND